MLFFSFMMKFTIIFREAHAEMSFLDFLQEYVFLVEEEYDGGGGEVAVVADTVEQVQTFVHTVLKEKTLQLKSRSPKPTAGCLEAYDSVLCEM